MTQPSFFLLPHEPERLGEVRRYSLLGRSPLPSLDVMTWLATRIFRAPVSLITLVEGNCVWFKSKQGLDLAETPREHSFCAEAILGNEVLIVKDAREDLRFSEYALVSGVPSVRFYAGAPLRSPREQNVGTLCVMDWQSRDLSGEERDVLLGLSKLVVDELELQLKILELDDEADRLRLAEENARQALTRLKNTQHELISEHIARELRNTGDVHHFPRTAFPSPWSSSTG